MRIETDVKLDYKDVLIRPKRSTLRSRKEVSLNREYSFRNSGRKWNGVPIMAANMDGVGTFDMQDALAEHGLFTCMVKHYSVEDWTSRLGSYMDWDRFALSTGTRTSDWKRAEQVLQKYKLNFICIDIANGYSEHFVDFVRKVRKAFPDITIIAGNVVTADMTQELILSGADIVKVGIGPGSVCTTRIQTGVGYPQLSAVIECADAAHGLGGHVIADGGCTCPGDVAKAFAAGADFVMLGGMFAGHNEGGGTVIERNGERSIQFYGMSSEAAMNKHSGGVADYRSSEGRLVEVPYRGPVRHTILDLLGGVRSTCTYVGASKLKELSRCTTFVRCTQQFNGVFT